MKQSKRPKSIPKKLYRLERLNMRMENNGVYLKQNNVGPDSYILVLATSRSGIMITYLTDNADRYYENIDGIYLDTIGYYAAFDRVIYIPWKKFNVRCKFCFKLNYRKMSSITTAIKQFMDGDIVCDDNGVFYYKDEFNALDIGRENYNSANTDADKGNASVEVSVETAVDTPSDKEEAVVSSAKEDTITETVVIKHDRTDFSKDKSNQEIINKAKEYDIPVDTSSDARNVGAKYINLLDRDDNGSRTIVNTCTNKGKRRMLSISGPSKRWFSEDEVLVIAYMNCNIVAKKYDVSRAIASTMIRNARKYFNINCETSARDNNKYTRLFEKGYTVEDVIKLFPDSDGRIIKSSFDRWALKGNGENSKVIFEEFKKKLDDNDLDTILDVYDMTVIEFCKKYECAFSIATEISGMIRSYLYKNIFFAAGFGRDSFDENKLRERIDSIRNSSAKADISACTNYDTCIRLKKVFEENYQDRFDIIMGLKEVPKSVDKSDIDRLLSLFYNSTQKQIFNSKRPYTASQKETISVALSDNGICRMMLSTEFMVPYSMTTSVKNTFIRQGYRQ